MNAANQVSILAVQKDGYSGNAYQQVAIELQERLTLTEAAYKSLFERHAALQRENAHLIDTMGQVVPEIPKASGGELEELRRAVIWSGVELSLSYEEVMKHSGLERNGLPLMLTAHQVDEICCEYGPPEYVSTEDGEAWYWRFSGHELPVGDNLSDILSFAANHLPAPPKAEGA